MDKLQRLANRTVALEAARKRASEAIFRRATRDDGGTSWWQANRRYWNLRAAINRCAKLFRYY